MREIGFVDGENGSSDTRNGREGGDGCEWPGVAIGVAGESASLVSPVCAS